MFVVGEYRDFQFSVRVDHSKSQPMDDELTHFKFLVPKNISGMAKFKFCTLVGHMKYYPSDLQIVPQVGVVTVFKL